MNPILCKQISLDYCCSPEAVLDHANHFTKHRFLEGRRRFQEESECYLKIAVINGKLLFCGEESILAWCREHYEHTGAEWFLQGEEFYNLNDRFLKDGWRIRQAHPFFLSEQPSPVDPVPIGYTLRWYRADEIEQFRGDDRYSHAYSFCPSAPDVIGVAALHDDRILGMAGASADSPSMWQIGIDINPEARHTGIARTLVTLLKNEILRQDILPYYGTAFSHLASQRVALGSGFLPSWVELVTSKSG